jgi:hypothetical protein
MGLRLNVSKIGERPEAGPCENGNKPSGPITMFRNS